MGSQEIQDQRDSSLFLSVNRLLPPSFYDVATVSVFFTHCEQSLISSTERCTFRYLTCFQAAVYREDVTEERRLSGLGDVLQTLVLHMFILIQLVDLRRHHVHVRILKTPSYGLFTPNESGCEKDQNSKTDERRQTPKKNFAFAFTFSRSEHSFKAHSRKMKQKRRFPLTFVAFSLIFFAFVRFERALKVISHRAKVKIFFDVCCIVFDLFRFRFLTFFRCEWVLRPSMDGPDLCRDLLS